MLTPRLVATDCKRCNEIPEIPRSSSESVEGLTPSSRACSRTLTPRILRMSTGIIGLIQYLGYLIPGVTSDSGNTALGKVIGIGITLVIMSTNVK